MTNNYWRLISEVMISEWHLYFWSHTDQWTLTSEWSLDHDLKRITGLGVQKLPLITGQRLKRWFFFWLSALLRCHVFADLPSVDFECIGIVWGMAFGTSIKIALLVAILLIAVLRIWWLFERRLRKYRRSTDHSEIRLDTSPWNHNFLDRRRGNQ